jgi:hypothetical protein
VGLVTIYRCYGKGLRYVQESDTASYGNKGEAVAPFGRLRVSS